jgi:hypothetical protein
MEVISYREALAQRVITGCRLIAPKLKTLADDIKALWAEFEALRPGETILGCKTKKAFCEAHIGRTPRAVRYLLGGGNHNRGEIVSPAPEAPEQDDEAAAFRLELEMFHACGRATGYVPTSLHDSLLARLARFEALMHYLTTTDIPEVVSPENTEKWRVWSRKAKLFYDVWDVLEDSCNGQEITKGENNNGC